MAMPGRRRGFSRGMRPVINSIKNIVYTSGALTTTNVEVPFVITKDQPVTSVNTEVQRGCKISRFWLSIDMCGTFTSAALLQGIFYIIKDPGANLTLPSASTEGSSNEKKFIIFSRQAMLMRNQDGNNPYHWEGWIKIPRNYQRFGTDDQLTLVVRLVQASGTGHFSGQMIYKWYT